MFWSTIKAHLVYWWLQGPRSGVQMPVCGYRPIKMRLTLKWSYKGNYESFHGNYGWIIKADLAEGISIQWINKGTQITIATVNEVWLRRSTRCFKCGNLPYCFPFHCNTVLLSIHLSNILFEVCMAFHQIISLYFREWKLRPCLKQPILSVTYTITSHPPLGFLIIYRCTRESGKEPSS